MRCCTEVNNERRSQKTEIKKLKTERHPRRLSVLSFLISAIVLSAFPLYACPMCKEAISKIHGLAQGFYWSILLMLSVPALIVIVISGVVIKAHRQSSPKPQ